MRKRTTILAFLSLIGLYLIFYFLTNTLVPHWMTSKLEIKEENAILDEIPRKTFHNLIKKITQLSINNFTYNFVNKQQKLVRTQDTLKFSRIPSKSVNNLRKDLQVGNIADESQCTLEELYNCNGEQLKEMFGNNFEVEMSTPSGFVEVKKLATNTSKSNYHKNHLTFEEAKKAFPEGDPKSRLMLQHRARSFPANSTVQKFLQIQKERVQLIQNICDDQEKIDKPVKLFNFLHIILDRADYITFCPIFKAASTSWSVLLLQMRGFAKKKVIKNIQKVISQTFQKVSNMVAPWMTHDTTKFLIVRHPFQRLISCYRDKFENAIKPYYYRKIGEKMVQRFRPKPESLTAEEQQLMLEAVSKRVKEHTPVVLRGNFYASPLGPTFEEFIKYVIYCKNDDEHWTPFYKHCAMCHLKYDVVLKFETLFADSQAFLLYLNRSDIIADRWDNPTSDGVTTTEVVCNYFSKIDSSLLSMLVDKYSLDFKFFDYSPEEYFKCTKKPPHL